MLKIELTNSTEHEVLRETAVYPSNNPNLRSRMEIHMAENAMTSAEFEALLSNTANTGEIHIVNDATQSDIAYFGYTLISSIGKKRVTTADITTGKTTDELHLVADLEQLTYTEQRLAELGL